MTKKAIIPKKPDAIKVIHAVQRQPRCESVMKPPLKNISFLDNALGDVLRGYSEEAI